MDQSTFNAALAVYASNLAAMAPHLFLRGFNNGGFSMPNFIPETPPPPIIFDCRRQMIEEDLLKKFQNQIYMRGIEQNNMTGIVVTTDNSEQSPSPKNDQQNLATLAEVASRLRREPSSSSAAARPWETLLAAAELQHKMKKNRATRKRRSSPMENDKIDATINDVIRSGTPCCSTAAAAAAAVDLSIKKRRSPPVVPDACRRQTFVHAVSSPPHHQQGLIGRVIYLTPDDRRLTNMEDVAKFLKEGKSNESSLDQFNFDPRVVSGEYYFIAQNGHAHKFTPEDTRPITRTLGYKI